MERMASDMYIYVLDTDGRPLMPTTRRRHVEQLLKHGKARIAAQVPFTIRLLEEKENRVTQPLMLGMDPGRTNIGAVVTDPAGRVVFSAVCETRNKEIPKLMAERKAHRQASRRGERKKRQRRARQFGTMMQSGCRMRKLPQYAADSFITVHIIKNTQARYCNRKRKKGWLTPTAEHLVRTHVNLVHKIAKFLPVTDITMEVNRFAFLQMEDPTVTGIDFQNGPLKGFLDVNEAIRHEQNGKCLMCENGIDHFHHIKPRSQGGSDTLKNIAGLCECCHARFHTEDEFRGQVLEKKAGLNKKCGTLSVLNQAIPYIWERLVQEYGTEHIHATDGKQTYHTRKHLFLPDKDKENPMHDVDAYLIACQGMELEPDSTPDMESYEIRQFRRHDRAVIKSQRERTYKLDGKTIAKNRKPRFEQKGPALDQWYRKQVKAVGEQEAEKLRSRLKVIKSTRYYNKPGRLLPGTVFYYDGKRYVMSGQLSGGMYLRAVGDSRTNFPVAKSRVTEKNSGLVFL